MLRLNSEKKTKIDLFLKHGTKTWVAVSWKCDAIQVINYRYPIYFDSSDGGVHHCKYSNSRNKNSLSVTLHHRFSTYIGN